MFSKRVSELQISDMKAVITEQWQEGSQFELKETLPSRNKEGDPWLSSQENIGDYARNQIVKEVIAFANAHGGTLIIGITETSDKPARAGKLTPLPKCHDLAERLKLMCRDCVEPKLAIIDVVGIPADDSGEGVVVFQVPPSRYAPHRHIQTNNCYVRRADRSEEMTMREIQDLTLNLERGLAQREKRFTEQRQLFLQAYTASMDYGEVPSVAIRITLLPLADIYIERVHGNDAVRPSIHNFIGMFGEGKAELWAPYKSQSYTPILRGTRTQELREDHKEYREVHCDGLIEFGLLMRLDEHNGRHQFYPGWFMGSVANALATAERFRRTAGTPEVEYGLEIEFWISRAGIAVMGYGRDIHSFGTLEPGHVLFPRYSIAHPSEFSGLCAVIERDFWDHVGYDSSSETPIQIDFSDAL